MKKVLFITVLTVVSFFLTVPQTVRAKEQGTCPLMGGNIDKNFYADHNGKRVYFCCGGCVAPFKKDPEKYIKKLESEGIELAKAPVVKEEKQKQDADHTGHKH
jgi:YHS domain-containing protein